MALPIIREFESTRDGRGTYLKFLNVYEGKHNIRQMATMAMGRLNSIQMQYNSPGGIPVFLTKFRDAIQDLKDANNPISDVMAKSLLLSKIRDRNYSHIVDALMVSNDNCDECMQRLLDKHNMLNQGKGPGPPRNANNTNTKGRNNNRGKNNKGNQNSNTNVAHQNNNMLGTMTMLRPLESLQRFGTSGLRNRGMLI